MTLQQLKYAICIADKGSFNEAAKTLFISQPSLSNAIKELEHEIGITIFSRTNRGIRISSEGEEFLGYARQIIQQASLLEEKYLHTGSTRQRFSVSTHHYLFAANAFVELVQKFGGEEYEFTYRETHTFEVIDDVKHLRSEIGLIYLSRFNEAVITKLLKESNLVFQELFMALPHVFLYKHHPLANKKQLHLEDLENFPYISFEQGRENSFYFSEEILSTRYVKQSIKVSDRAAMVNMMIGVAGYTICSGIFPEYLHGDDIISIPLCANEEMHVGIITHKDVVMSRLGTIYLEALQKMTQSFHIA